MKIFVDIDKKDWCISPKSFEAAITDKTKAVVVVDLYGNMPQMDEILAILDDSRDFRQILKTIKLEG